MDRVSLSPDERIVTSFNVTVVQVYALTSEHDNNEIDNFYQLIQEIIKIPEKDKGGGGGVECISSKKCTGRLGIRMEFKNILAELIQEGG